MKQSIQRIFKSETFIAVLLIILTTLVTHGINLPKLGYYYDDWYLLWSGQARGAESIIPLFSTDRPFMGVVYSMVYRLLGDTIINWHLYALLWRLIRSEEHTSELQSQSNLVCRLLLEKKKEKRRSIFCKHWLSS